MEKKFPRPDGTGFVQGDDAPMPDRGTGTGMAGDTYGADLSQSAINRQGGMGKSAKSDCCDARPGTNHNGKM